MGNKSFLNTLFLTCGTALLIGMTAITAMNFSRDARILKKPLLTIVNGESAIKGSNKGKDGEVGYRTLKVDNNSSGSSSDSAKKTNTDDNADKTELKIELINYSGIKDALEEASERLEAQGYKVTGIKHSKQDTGTLIIVRKKGVSGETVKKLLKTGRIVRWLDDKSRYDITVKLGIDYSP